MSQNILWIVAIGGGLLILLTTHSITAALTWFFSHEPKTPAPAPGQPAVPVVPANHPLLSDIEAALQKLLAQKATASGNHPAVSAVEQKAEDFVAAKLAEATASVMGTVPQEALAGKIG